MGFCLGGVGFDCVDSSCWMRVAWLSNLSFICFIECNSYVRMSSCWFGWMGVCGGGAVSGGDVGGGVLVGELVRSMVASGVVGEAVLSLIMRFVLLGIVLIS